MEVKDACRYTSKAFRRWASQEITQRGSGITTFRSPGGWVGPGFGSYVELEFSRAKRITKLLTAQPSVDSSTEKESENQRENGGLRGGKFEEDLEKVFLL